MENFALQQSLLMGKFCITASIVGRKYFALKQSLLLRTNVAYLHARLTSLHGVTQQLSSRVSAYLTWWYKSTGFRKLRRILNSISFTQLNRAIFYSICPFHQTDWVFNIDPHNSTLKVKPAVPGKMTENVTKCLFLAACLWPQFPLVLCRKCSSIW